ncbi:hypothetical protein ACHQM5_022236 [Ranunculus cassubicifolius]
MEKTSSNTLPPSFSLAFFLEFILFNILTWITAFKKFYWSSRCFYELQCQFFVILSGRSKLPIPTVGFGSETDKEMLSKEDMEMVMESLKLQYNKDEDMVQQRFGAVELLNVFEDMEPSVQELKDAFDIFDENRDGFVDEIELQRVLRRLGFREGSMVQDCEKMIRAFDQNGDGRIDFIEFMKLMEKSFC